LYRARGDLGGGLEEMQGHHQTNIPAVIFR
jgi:hypothetical protein